MVAHSKDLDQPVRISSHLPHLVNSFTFKKRPTLRAIWAFFRKKAEYPDFFKNCNAPRWHILFCLQMKDLDQGFQNLLPDLN